MGWISLNIHQEKKIVPLVESNAEGDFFIPTTNNEQKRKKLHLKSMKKGRKKFKTKNKTMKLLM